MFRWHNVKGVPGRLVGHPQQGSARRFVGKRRRSDEEVAKLTEELGPLDLAQHYEDVDEVVEADATVLGALAAGDLVSLAGPVVANTPAKAREQLAAAPAPKATKKPSGGTPA